MLMNKYQLLHRQGWCGRKGAKIEVSHMELSICGAQLEQAEQKEEEKMLNGPSTGKLVSRTEATVMKSKAWRYF